MSLQAERTLSETSQGLLPRFFQFAASRKFPLLNGLAVLLGFFLLPGWILYRGIDASVGAFKDNQIQKARRNLESRLDQLEFFAANDQFAHYLLAGICHDRNGRARGLGAVRHDLKRLKKRFPGFFTFAVADLKGNLISDISDLTGYAFLYRQAFSLIEDAEAVAARKLDGSAIPDVQTRLKRLRPLLGNLLQIEDLTLPLRGRRNGRSICASGAAGKFHLWYGSGSDFRLICFISRSFIRGQQGLEWATDVLNRLDPDTVTGFASYPPQESSLVPELSSRDTADVIQALARREGPWFESSTEWNRTRVACRFLRQELRGFSFYKAGRHAYRDDASLQVLGGIVRFCLLLGFIFFVHNLRHPVSLTVKLRLMAFFAYAVCLPLLVIASLTMQYIEQSEKELISELKSDAQRAIEKIDADYIWFQKELARRTAEYLHRTVERCPELLLDRVAMTRFHDGLKAEVNHGEIMIVSTSGEDYLLGIGRSISKNRVLMSRLGRDALKVAIVEKFASLSSELPLLVMHLADDFYYRQNSIGYLGVGDFEISAFYRLLRPQGSELSASMFAGVFWQLREMHRDYIRQHCRQMFLEAESMEFAVLDTEDDSLLVAPQLSGSELIRFMKLSMNRFSTNADRLRIAGRDCIAVAMPAKNLDQLILAAFVPADVVSRHTASLVMRARFLALFLVMIVVATFILLHDWVFKPLAELKAGIEAIGSRDFHKRLEIIGKNELGRLTAAFNHSLETLQDLAVAGVVQESLLPEPHLIMNRVEVVAKTSAMTDLGGDYYDMVKLDEQSLLLFIGDATGHGIPAALSMAMAKAIIQHESGRGLSGKILMQQFNQVFNRLRSQGSRDFMTALCVEINTLTGCASLINAGHPFPMLLQAQGENALVLDQIRGLPPGFDSRREFSPCKLQLEPGDSLLLFTDGFVESVDRKGGQMGFNGLARLIAVSRQPEPAEHLERIFAEFSRNTENGQDDCTMVVIKFT